MEELKKIPIISTSGNVVFLENIATIKKDYKSKNQINKV